MTPIKPYDDQPGDPSRDEAKTGYSLYALERMLSDCAEQPDWRPRADLANAYYDGKQLSQEQKYMIQQERLDERSTNLIRPVINSVLGQEAKSRTDVTIESDEDEYVDVVDAFKPRLKEAERETRAHMAVSEGYASGVKGGLGWVEVERNADPLAYRYRVEFVDRNEIWWDYRSQRGVTLDNCRWLVRKRWIDLDEIEASMPEHKVILRAAVNGWDSMILDARFLSEPDEQVYSSAYETERRFNVVRRDWVDTARKMIKVYEIWYRVPAVVVVLDLTPTKSVEYDQNDPRHIEAVARGLVKVRKAVSMQVRRALYAGPHRLLDEGTSRRHFPYVPFFAFRDDADKSPYGLIEGMIAPQDEFNERRLRIQWMLKAKQVQMDSDALDPEYNTVADIAEAVMRPDLVAITNPQRTNRGQAAIKIGNDMQLQAEQFTVMQDSKQLIQDTAGRYASQLGSAKGGVTSGVANSLLIEQGEQSMGEMNDNYVFFRRSVFEQLVDLIAQDHRAENLKVTIGNGKTRRVVVLNSWDANTGMPVNQVKDAAIKTAMSDIPSTPAFRRQTQNNIATIIQALQGNPKAVEILTPAFIESSDINNREQVASDLRKASGMPDPGDKEGQARAQEEAAVNQKKQAAMAEQLAAVTLADRQAGAALKKAQADEIVQRMKADPAQSAASKTQSEIELNRARVLDLLSDDNEEPDHAKAIEDSLAEAEA